MDRLYIFCAVFATSLIGLASIARNKRGIGRLRQLAQDYQARLGRYISSGGSDSDSYSWLTQRAPAMQRQLGRTGILAAFRPPFADFQYTNYQILLNMLPELRKAFVDSYALGRLASEYGATVQETMLRHLGEIDECETNLGKEVRNPFVWLREGARTILAIPLYLLQWFGIISESITDKVTGNFIFRMLSSVAVIVGFIGSVITIVLGWEQFSRMMNISSFSSFLTQRQVHGVQTPSTTHQTTQTSLQPNPSAAAAPNTASGSQAPSRINR